MVNICLKVSRLIDKKLGAALFSLWSTVTELDGFCNFEMNAYIVAASFIFLFFIFLFILDTSSGDFQALSLAVISA